MSKRKIEVKPDWYDEELEAAVPRRPKWHRWSAEQDAMLRQYYPRGVPLDVLAERVNHTKQSTKYRLHMLEIKRLPLD